MPTSTILRLKKATAIAAALDDAIAANHIIGNVRFNSENPVSEVSSILETCGIKNVGTYVYNYSLGSTRMHVSWRI